MPQGSTVCGAAGARAQGEGGGGGGGQREQSQQGEGCGHGQRLIGVEQFGPRSVEGQPGHVPAQVEEDGQGHGAAEGAGDGGGNRRDQSEPYGSQPGRVQPVPGAVAGSVRATATANWTVTASGTRAHSSWGNDPAGRAVASASTYSSRKPLPAEAAATSSRRSWTSGREPRARRRASTRPGPPGVGGRRSGGRRPRRPGVRRAGRPAGRRRPRSPRRGWPAPR